MYVLLFIAMLANGNGVTIEHLYFESELTCHMAAKDIEDRNSRFADYKFKAFCVKGD